MWIVIGVFVFCLVATIGTIIGFLIQITQRLDNLYIAFDAETATINHMLTNPRLLSEALRSLEASRREGTSAPHPKSREAA